MNDIIDKIKVIQKLMELEKIESESCKDCKTCMVSKTLKEKIILLSAQIIAEQAERARNYYKNNHFDGYDEESSTQENESSEMPSLKISTKLPN